MSGQTNPQMALGPITFDYLASSLDNASKGGHLPNPWLRIDLDEDNNHASTKSFILAIRSRLVDLGYLGESKKNRSKASLDGHLKKAIRKFQKEAGLKRDAWVGPKTWNTLQQLVSFEDDQEPANWKDLIADLSQPAITRAVYLRLYVLGFFDWKKKLNTKTDTSLASNESFKSAFDNFLEVAHTLGLTEIRLVPKISLETLRVLFQQDEMVHALSRNPNFVRDKKNKKFTDAVARIELWLLGFDVNVGKPRILKPRQNSGLPEKVSRLPQVLDDFWEHQPDQSKPGTKIARRKVTPEFFNQLVALEEEDLRPIDQVEKDLVSRISKFSKDERAQLNTKLKNVASSIWDGVKRVFRWIKRFIKSIVSTALNVIKNIARFIAKHACSVFGTVLKAIEILYRGAVYLRNKVLPGSDAKKMVIYHDNDFDLGVFISLDAETETINRMILQIEQETFYFGAACKILGHLMAIFRRVVQSVATGFGAWFLCLLALAQLARRITAIAEEVKKVKAFEIERHVSPFFNIAF